jgi:hypothetical protein
MNLIKEFSEADFDKAVDHVFYLQKTRSVLL